MLLSRASRRSSFFFVRFYARNCGEIGYERFQQVPVVTPKSNEVAISPKSASRGQARATLLVSTRPLACLCPHFVRGRGAGIAKNSKYL